MGHDRKGVRAREGQQLTSAGDGRLEFGGRFSSEPTTAAGGTADPRSGPAAAATDILFSGEERRRLRFVGLPLAVPRHGKVVI